MTELRKLLTAEKSKLSEVEKDNHMEVINIDFLIHDILIIKAESLRDQKIFSYAEYIEKQLMKIKRKEAKLEL